MSIWDIDEDLDLSDIDDDAFEDVLEDETERFINNEDKAVELIGTIIGTKSTDKEKKLNDIRTSIEEMFALFSEISLEDELDGYERFITLCGRLEERQKIRAIKDKVVLGIAGQFSAGKSAFINAIAGLDGLLPEKQDPTTSIPTYVIKGAVERYCINTKDGNTAEISREQVKGLTHGFYNKYHIGFSSFVESMIIETPDFKLPNNIAILDTPGYTKAEGGSSRKNVTDELIAYDQLKNADYVIWIANIDPGITESDINFLQKLDIHSPLLFVLSKADTVTSSNLGEMIRHNIDIVNNISLNTSDKVLTSYSAFEGKEYNFEGTAKIIPFIKQASTEKTLNNDLLQVYDDLTAELGRKLQTYIKQLNASKKALYNTINTSISPETVVTVIDTYRSVSVELKKAYSTKWEFEQKNRIIRKKIEVFIGRRAESV